MGVTCQALDINLDAPVALKVINALYTGNDAARERFIREARAAASLRRRSVASIHHLGRDEQSFFYAMEPARSYSSTNSMTALLGLPTM